MRARDMLAVFVWGFVAAWLLSRFGLLGWFALFVVFLVTGRRR